MKRFFLVLLTFAVVIVSAQNESDIYSLDLSIPTSPGFSILDKAPESINRPHDANALGISILNSFTENYGLPSNYAIEIAPYWYSNKAKSYDSYIGLKLVNGNVGRFGNLNNNNTVLHSIYQEENYVQQNIWSKLKQSSISLAYVNAIQTDSANYAHNVSLGFRLPLINVKSKYTIANYLDARNSYLSIINNENIEILSISNCAAIVFNSQVLSEEDVNEIGNMKYQIESIDDIGLTLNTTKLEALAQLLYISELEYTAPNYLDYYDSFIFTLYLEENLEENNPDLFELLSKVEKIKQQEEEANLKDHTAFSALKMKEALNDLPLFRIELAGAGSIFFSENNFSSIQHGRSGLWLTLELNKKGSPRLSNKFKYISLLTLARFFADGTQLDANGRFSNTFAMDAGAKLILEFKRFNFGAEGLYRYHLNEQIGSYRISSNIGIAVSDKINLTASFGRNFGDNNNIISVMGLDWSFLQNLLNIHDNFKSN